MAFEQRFRVGWSHVDANRHMANTAYLEMAVNVRIMYFAENGFGSEAMARHQIGPVIKTDELEYYREVHMLDEVRVNALLAGLSEDASRFRVRNEFWRDDTLVARVTSVGGWLDLKARKLAVPPEALAAALRAMPRSDDFAPIPAPARKAGAG